MPVRGSVLNSGPPPICEMGDHVTLAQAIESALDAAGPVNGGLERAAQFSSERIAAEYLRAMAAEA